MFPMRNAEVVSGSFRDPSGFLFHADGVLYRQVNTTYREDYQTLFSSGLYDSLTQKGLLIPHEEVEHQPFLTAEGYKVIRPTLIPFVSYPYEWCFSQLKDAALLTLDIQLEALKHGMSLKDASSFNVQFIGAKPVFIDTLSFERYQEGEPWIAYQQFCQHFLAPLALIAECDVNLRTLGVPFLDGVPLSLASTLLPRSSWFKFSHLIHIHLHARSQTKYADAAGSRKLKPSRAVRRTALLGIIDSLRTCVAKLSWRPGGTEWADYYEATNYSSQALSAKEKIVDGFINVIKPRLTWDLGANNGLFSRRAVAHGSYTVACDVDPSAVEKNYRGCKLEKNSCMLPLIIDLTNPSPALGWAHTERRSLLDRGPAELVLALALIHHIAISKNVPLPRLAEFFASCGRALVIEFVPKPDSQVQKLLASRKDIFPEYNQEGFERAFSEFFTIEQAVPVPESHRVLYLMRRK
jgi:ribosomal protein L11 methylase PrmA